MATQTTNYNLSKPEATDPFSQFRQSYNDNMDIIDANLGGGGGSGGHTIIDENDTPMTQRTGLQFTGNVSVSDDAVNDKTVVDILGGGGNVYGAFIDTDRVIASGTFAGSLTYTATEDCYAVVGIVSDNSSEAKIYIDGVIYTSLYNTGGASVYQSASVYLRKGQVMTVAEGNGAWTVSYTVYALIQGTNGIFAPVIYSDTERVIGVWRDNKPLYQKTIYTNNATVNNAVTISVSSLNIDSLVDIEGTYDRIVNWISPPLHMVYCFDGLESNDEQSFIRYDKDDKNILYRIILANNEATSYQAITIQYTKTTDVAGSGNWNTDGVPTVHYSTSEQVIGTWENGKPLYEKVVKNLSIALNGSDWVYYNTPNDIDEVINLECYSDNGGKLLHCAISEYRVSLSNGVQFSGFSGMNRTVNEMVIRYTKTTD